MKMWQIQKSGWPLPPTFGSPKTHNFARFRTTLRLDRKYLRNATRHHQSENGVANLIRCTLVYKWQKTEPKFWPTQWVASSIYNITPKSTLEQQSCYHSLCFFRKSNFAIFYDRYLISRLFKNIENRLLVCGNPNFWELGRIGLFYVTDVLPVTKKTASKDWIRDT